MKYFVILLILIGFVSFLSINNIYAMPPINSQRIYDHSDVILLGKVISVNSTFSPTHNLYQIKAEKFIKNQQDSDIVFASGQKTVNTRSGNSVFSVNDRGLFYLSNDTMKYDRYSGIFRVLPESRLIEPEWDKCNIFENDIPQEHWILGGVEPTPKIFQERNSDIENIKNNESVIISHDVSNISNTKQEFDLDGILSRSNGTGFETMSNMSQHVILEPCTVFKTIEWRFTPGMTGSYLFEINGSNSGTSYGIGFTVKESIINSPLKQFKSGIYLKDTKCKESLILVTKYDDSPACIKPESYAKLILREWALVPKYIPGEMPIGIEIPNDVDKKEFERIMNENKTPFIADKDEKIKLDGRDALDICGAVRLPCPTNPIFSGKMIDENNVFVMISGTIDFEVKLNQTHVCVTSKTETTCEIR